MLQQHLVSCLFSIGWVPHHTFPSGGMGGGGGGNYNQGSGGGYNQGGGEGAGHFMACLGWFGPALNIGLVLPCWELPAASSGWGQSRAIQRLPGAIRPCWYDCVLPLLDYLCGQWVLVRPLAEQGPWQPCGTGRLHHQVWAIPLWPCSATLVAETGCSRTVVNIAEAALPWQALALASVKCKFAFREPC